MEIPEEIIDRITRGDGYTPLTLESTLGYYYIIDGNGVTYHFLFTKEEIINALKQNKNDIKKAFHDLIKLGEQIEKEGKIEQRKFIREELREQIEKEGKIQGEIVKLKEIEQRKFIREEAEKRIYGKAKQNTRSPISEKDKEIIFNKFNNECAICSIKEGLHIHHKDQNPSNNKMDNLILLCGVCHKKIHMKVR